MNTVKKYKKLFITTGLLNFVMLLFGFLGETKRMPNILAVILGFIPFAYMFGLMYTNFVDTPERISSKENKNLFYLCPQYGLYMVFIFQQIKKYNV